MPVRKVPKPARVCYDPPMIVLHLLAQLWLAMHDAMSASRVSALRVRVQSQGDVQVDVSDQVDAAVSVETRRVSAELLLSLGFSETRYEARGHNTGRVCGPLQVSPVSLGLDHASTCAIWERDMVEAYAAGVLEIETMLADRRVHGSLALALAYRACGNAAFVPDSKCAHDKHAWPSWVLWRARLLAHDAPST